MLNTSMKKLRTLVICPFLLLGCMSQPPAPDVTVMSPPSESTAVYEPIASEKLFLQAAPPPPPKIYAPKYETKPKSKDSYAMMGDGGGSRAETGRSIVLADTAAGPKPTKKSKKAVKTVEKPTVTVSALTPVAQDDVMIQLSQAAIAFNVPDKTINIDETFDIQLVIDPSKTAAELAKTITESGVVISNTITISKIVEVQIVAPKFTITTTTPDKQAIATTAPTTWEWTLKPNEAGKQTIKVSVNAIVLVGGKKAPRHISTFEQYITVNITTDQILVRWFKQYWQWLFTALLIPLAVYGWKSYRSGRAAKANHSSDAGA